VGNSLELARGYLGRILDSFEKRGLIEKTPSEDDRRQILFALTGEGRQQFVPREARTIRQVGGMLGRLSESEQRQLIGAMQTIKKVLAPEVLYAQEYGYDEEFEAFTGEIVAKFIRHHDAKRERCWIAEKDGEVVGSVFPVAKSRTTAKIEPSARGLGSGSRLVDECVRFALQAGYRKMELWTQSELDAAQHIYKKAGFRVVEKKRHHSFGRNLVAETWELSL